MEAETSIVASVVRIAVLAVFFTAVLRTAIGARGAARASRLTWVLVMVILGSASMGIEYALFWFPSDLEAARSSGSSTRYYYYNLSAALVFAGAQFVAAVDAVRGDRRYLAWLLPAVAYIVGIGLVGLVGFGMRIAIPADLFRAGLLLGLVLANERARGSASRGVS